MLLSAAVAIVPIGCSVVENLDDLNRGASNDAVVSGNAGQASDPLPGQTQPSQSQDAGPPLRAFDTPMSVPDGSDLAIGEDSEAPSATESDSAGFDQTMKGGEVAQSEATSPPDGSADAQVAQTSEMDVGTAAAATVDAQQGSGWCAANSSATTVDCHDFDEGKAAEDGFASHYYTAHYSSVTSTDFAPGSSPSSLLVSTPMLALGGAPLDEQFNDLVPFHDKVELSFALKIVDYDPTAGYLSLFRVSYVGGAWAAEFDLQQTGASFEESVTTFLGVTRLKYTAAQPMSLDEWTTVDCVFDFVNHKLSLSYDGVPIVTNQTIANPDQGTPIIFVQVGLNYLVSPAKPMMIYYDNILLSTP